MERTAFVTTSSNNPFRSRRGSATRAFTLVEVLIAATLGGILLTGVITSFLMMGRSGAVLYNYVGMEEQARRGLEKFGEDTRMASAVNWTDNTRVALTIPHVASDAYSNTVTYWWDTTAGSPTYHCFMRLEANTDSTGHALPTTTTTLIQNVYTFQFDRWTAGGTSNVQATGSANTDQLQIHLTLRVQGNQYGTTSSAVAAATNLVVSARYILRNKTS